MKTRFLYPLIILALISCKKTEVVTPTPVVPVVPVLSEAKQLTTYSFTKSANASLAADVTASIDETAKTVTATLPYSTDLGSLKASFTVSAKATVKVGTTLQESGVTTNNFNQPITLVLTAENGATQNYIVTLTLAQPPASSNLVLKREEFAPGPPVQTVPTQTVDYSYNANNQLLAFKDVGGNYTFEYDANGLLKTQTIKDNNGNVTNTLSYALNANKMPVTISGTYGQTVESYTYAGNGQVAKVTKSYYGSIKDTYEYTHDSKNRIATVKYTSANEAPGLYAVTTYQYYDDVFDPDPMIKVFIRPGIFGGVDPATGTAYALKGYSYQKYNADGPINASQASAYTYSKNANGFIASLSDGTGGSLYKYTFK